MNTVFVDSSVTDESRRGLIYEGQIFVFSPRPSSLALCQFAQTMIEDAFAGIDPRTAQYVMSVEEYVGIVAPLKPKFIHHPKTLHLIRAVAEEFGCDLSSTYLDVPRLRMVTHGGYLTSGVGYAHHPHRDTWYSAPMCQLNWWLPIYPLESECSMAFHPRYWKEPVTNTSERFNYYQWNADGRRNAAKHIKADTREQPHAAEPIEVDLQIRFVCPPGGLILFSGAQLHSTVANTSGYTRYSIDFRTINMNDVLAGHGAPNIDSSPTGTSVRDFVRAVDFAPMPEDVARLHDPDVPAAGTLVFEPPQTSDIRPCASSASPAQKRH